ncbi:hypothetical protein SPBR_07651 [Sporothrix brasiliensis 5110]|uniref:Uncharacterized protein n=1 Tax=Sporothrix brasiliensis 5110 TaxID=1398154 RepID=A0A0C2IWM8_9PEZI|nr:uncharacterized protein SPBR_07651 [Sporothrix brasiliensis 5110]KIH89422.1 hypothetical protein SPBR_07651 [Sporothrix brasiliensis 5110]
MPAPFRPVQPIIWINGWPAMGKLALAQCICQLLGQDRAVVIDDREFTDQLNLPRDALMSRHVSRSGGRPRGLSVGDINGNTHTHRYNAKQEACFRKFVYGDEDDEAIKNGKVDAVQRQRVIIFTDCRANDKVGAEGARRYENAARDAGRQFVPIYVECLPEEQERRAKSSDKLYTQVEGAAMTGAEAARELQALADGRLFTFPQDTVPGLYINVTNQLIHDSAMKVISFINAIAEKRTDAVKESAAASARRRHGIFVALAIENKAI